MLFPRRTGQLNIPTMRLLGFKVVRELDPFFLEVVLPDAWYTMRDPARPSWTWVCDGNDHLRCQLMMGHHQWETIFANWLRRYNYDLDWHPRQPRTLRWTILDDGVIVYETPWQQTSKANMTNLGISYVRQAVAYLNALYPQWRDILAYW